MAVKQLCAWDVRPSLVIASKQGRRIVWRSPMHGSLRTMLAAGQVRGVGTNIPEQARGRHAVGCPAGMPGLYRSVLLDLLPEAPRMLLDLHWQSSHLSASCLDGKRLMMTVQSLLEMHYEAKHAFTQGLTCGWLVLSDQTWTKLQMKQAWNCQFQQHCQIFSPSVIAALPEVDPPASCPRDWGAVWGVGSNPLRVIPPVWGVAGVALKAPPRDPPRDPRLIPGSRPGGSCLGRLASRVCASDADPPGGGAGACAQIGEGFGPGSARCKMSAGTQGQGLAS